MKYIADWWGIQLVADNEDDKVLLRKLNEALQNPSIHECYEDGEITLFESWVGNRFSSFNLTNGDFVLQMER